MTFEFTALLTNNARQFFGGTYEVRKQITVSIARYYGLSESSSLYRRNNADKLQLT